MTSRRHTIPGTAISTSCGAAVASSRSTEGIAAVVWARSSLVEET
jgi:hypothetical protein